MTEEITVVPGAGIGVRHEFGVTEVVRQAELQQSALMAQQKALIEARFLVAYRNRRQWPEIRINVNRLCDDPDFAAEALYVKPIAATPRDWSKMSKREQLQSAPETWPQGFSIRFVETVLFECGNFDAPAVVIWEDEQKRITQVSVIDLERNSAYHRTVVTEKTVERKKLADGQEAVATRTNSWGDTIYLVAATTDQVALAEASGVSKAIRTLGERLLRPDLKREWRLRCERAIMDKAAKDPEGEKKKILDSFAEKGVRPSAIETYLEKPISGAQPADILELRKIYQALASGECTWKDVIEAKFGAEEEISKPAGALRLKLEKARAAAAQPKEPEQKPPQEGGETKGPSSDAKTAETNDEADQSKPHDPVNVRPRTSTITREV